MAKSKRKRKLEAKNRKDEKKVFTVIAISTVLIIIIMYISFAS